MTKKLFLISLIVVAICVEEIETRSALKGRKRSSELGRSTLKSEAQDDDPCDRLYGPCSEVNCSGTCEQRPLACYNGICEIADADPFKKKRSISRLLRFPQ